jgi:hypothetical protein
MARGWILGGLVALGLVGTAHAGATHDAAVWASVSVVEPVGDGPVRGWFDGHARRGGPSFLAIVRPGVGLQVTDATSVWAGVGWIPVLADGKARHEGRLWQQVIGAGSAGPVAVQGRLRVEQRLGWTPEIGLRGRLLGRIAGRPTDPARPTWVVWDEVFVGANDTGWGGVRGLDQNRLFVGVAAPLAGGGKVELGALSVVLPREDLNLVWAFSLSVAPALRRREG